MDIRAAYGASAVGYLFIFPFLLPKSVVPFPFPDILTVLCLCRNNALLADCAAVPCPRGVQERNQPRSQRQASREAHREATSKLVQGLSGQIFEAVAAGRGLPLRAVRSAVDGAPIMAPEAAKRGLVTATKLR